jgi:hypothetical protein
MNIPLLLIVVLAVVALAFGLHLSNLAQLAQLRRSGLYPAAGQASMADVERLLNRRLPTLAMRCYREIHGCSLRQAKEAVEVIAIREEMDKAC